MRHRSDQHGTPDATYTHYGTVVVPGDVHSDDVMAVVADRCRTMGMPVPAMVTDTQYFASAARDVQARRAAAGLGVIANHASGVYSLTYQWPSSGAVVMAVELVLEQPSDAAVHSCVAGLLGSEVTQ